LQDFVFIPALSDAGQDGSWTGETGFIHEVLGRRLREEGIEGEEVDAYLCGPPPMIDAALPVLMMQGVEQERIHIDKFTTSMVVA
jgi:propane monooxygenase reductase subunit